MTNAFSLFRSLIVYGVCLPLAIFVGYLLATPADFTTQTTLGLLLLLMTIPLFLRFHYPWLILSWNLVGGLYFLPGKPSFALVMIGVSLGISFLAYIMNRNLRFISAPTILRPLIFILVVILGTAQLTGGIGLNVLGSDAIGGKRYVYLLAGIVGFFAISAQAIPVARAPLYVTLYFIGPISSAIGNLFAIITPNLYFIFQLFPADTGAASAAASDTGITRLSGVGAASVAAISVLLAHFGIQGLLNLRKSWRLFLFSALLVTSLFGGFRSMVIQVALTIMILFYLEGLTRTKLLPAVILAFILIAAISIPFANRLPLSVQRSLTFLPLQLDPEAELNAKGSTDWRLEMWRNLLPLIPQYLAVGKGLGIDARDLNLVNTTAMNRGNEVAAGAILAGDYHSGPLSLIIQFGLAGVIGFLWLLSASYKVLSNNYRYGNPELVNYNRFILTYFFVRIVLFFFIVGSFYSDMAGFLGLVAFSLALNNGVAEPMREFATRPYVARFRLHHAARLEPS